MPHGIRPDNGQPVDSESADEDTLDSEQTTEHAEGRKRRSWASTTSGPEKKAKTRAAGGDAYASQAIKAVNATLVVCSKSILGQWSAQVEQHCDQSKVTSRIYDEATALRASWDEDTAQQLRSSTFVFATIDMVRKEYQRAVAITGHIGSDDGASSDDSDSSDDDAENGANSTEWDEEEGEEAEIDSYSTPFLFSIVWKRVVVDEAHNMRNRKTLVFRALCHLATNIRWALTGTPFVNNLEDIGSLLIWLGLEPFRQKPSLWTSNVVRQVKANDQLAVQLQQMVCRDFVLRRTKDSLDVRCNKLVQLPPIDEEHVLVPLSPIDLQYYQRFVAQARKQVTSWMPTEGNKLSSAHKTAILAIIVRLRQMSCDRRLLVNADLDALLGQPEHRATTSAASSLSSSTCPLRSAKVERFLEVVSQRIRERPLEKM